VVIMLTIIKTILQITTLKEIEMIIIAQISPTITVVIMMIQIYNLLIQLMV